MSNTLYILTHLVLTTILYVGTILVHISLMINLYLIFKYRDVISDTNYLIPSLQQGYYSLSLKVNNDVFSKLTTANQGAHCIA